MGSIDELDKDALRDLTTRTSEAGVLSAYHYLDPADDPETGRIDMANRARELLRNLRAGQAAQPRTVETITRLFDGPAWAPSAPGVGNISFIDLTGDWSMHLTCPMPVANRLVLDDGPFIHPLIELLDEGRPAGVVVMSGTTGRIYRWQLGALALIEQIDDDEVESRREPPGQIGGGPAGQYHTPAVEHWQAKENSRARRFARKIADRAAAMVAEQGWDRILVSAGTTWTGMVADLVQAPPELAILQDPRILAGLDDAAFAHAVAEQLHAHHIEREQQQAAQIARSAPGTVALGLSEVAAALNEGRVAHLIYDPRVRFRGAVTDDGTLLAGTEEAPGGGEPRPDSRFTERLVHRALATTARISPLEGAAATSLAAARGIAATLRW